MAVVHVSYQYTKGLSASTHVGFTNIAETEHFEFQARENCTMGFFCHLEEKKVHKVDAREKRSVLVNGNVAVQEWTIYM